MDLATDFKDKAYKLQAWIENCRVLKIGWVNVSLRIIEDDSQSFSNLQTQVKGISSARTDITSGGRYLWCETHKGTSNVFLAVSITLRMCDLRADILHLHKTVMAM
jgi:hypothetical protein